MQHCFLKNKIFSKIYLELVLSFCRVSVRVLLYTVASWLSRIFIRLRWPRCQVDGVSVEGGYDRYMVTAKIGAENISGVERKSRYRDNKFD